MPRAPPPLNTTPIAASDEQSGDPLVVADAIDANVMVAIDLTLAQPPSCPSRRGRGWFVQQDELGALRDRPLPALDLVLDACEAA